MTLTIVIVSFNASADLDECLASLHAHPPTATTTSHEIIVVDNASTDGSPEMVRNRWPSVRLIPLTENIGFARANNLAIRESTGDLLLLLNSDTVVVPNALDGLVTALQADASAAAAGPRLVDPQGVAELSFGRMVGPFNELRQKLLVRLHGRRVRYVAPWVDRMLTTPSYPDWISGACLLVWRRDAEAVGLLDERYFMYLEDVDFCAALRAHGRRVLFVPTVEIVHLGGRSRRTAPVATNAAYRRSHLAFYDKHHPAWAAWLRMYLRLKRALPPPTAPTLPNTANVAEPTKPAQPVKTRLQ
jgi:N-acetylglucosaminyl-diphospho-decaprenol L-rhamnosyltransferase